jgi:pyrroline-5-carboxylate reductase
VIVVAVKPDVVPQALRELSTRITRHHLVISIAAGVTLQSLQHVRFCVFAFLRFCVFACVCV